MFSGQRVEDELVVSDALRLVLTGRKRGGSGRCHVTIGTNFKYRGSVGGACNIIVHRKNKVKLNWKLY